MTNSIDITDPNDFRSRVFLRMGKEEGRRMLRAESFKGSTARQGRTVGVLYDNHITVFKGVKSWEVAGFTAWAEALWSARFEADADSIKRDCWFDGLMVRLDNTY
tara:strand:+ start:335 stop:649 length:315 start_codon:yes stop_codon:yes gene_type:complete